MRCPTCTSCHSGTMWSALGFPPLSSLSQLYQPARAIAHLRQPGPDLLRRRRKRGGHSPYRAVGIWDELVQGVGLGQFVGGGTPVSIRGRAHRAYSTGTAHTAATRVTTAKASRTARFAVPSVSVIGGLQGEMDPRRRPLVATGLGARRARIAETSASTNTAQPVCNRMSRKSPADRRRSMTAAYASMPSASRPDRRPQRRAMCR